MSENRSELRNLAQEAIDELWITKETAFEPTSDIDIVWVVSAPGTVKDLPVHHQAPYEGKLFDLELVEHGISLVKDITALRLNKPSEDITKQDIEQSGPTLYYNGESASMGHRYPQNDHLKELSEEPDFIIPQSKLLIREIEKPNTPGQVEEITDYLKVSAQESTKVAVVCGLQHSIRVGRYLEHHKGLIPEGVVFVNAAMRQEHNEAAIAAVEARKVLKYYQMGHLARNTYFPIEGESKRPSSGKKA